MISKTNPACNWQQASFFLAMLDCKHTELCWPLNDRKKHDLLNLLNMECYSSLHMRQRQCELLLSPGQGSHQEQCGREQVGLAAFPIQCGLSLLAKGNLP